MTVFVLLLKLAHLHTCLLYTSHGPSWRMVVSLQEPIKSWGILPGGQAEDPMSPHYDDQFKLWKDYRYKELLFETNPTFEVSDTIKEVYQLVPHQL